MMSIIVLVDDNSINQLLIKKMITTLFGQSCELKIISFKSGTQANEFFLDTRNQYDIVILDGNLETDTTNTNSKISNSIAFFEKTSQPQAFNGPDVAITILEKNPNANIVVWTDDETMLSRFKTIFTQKKGSDLLLQLKKPCNLDNLKEVLTPLIFKKAPKIPNEISSECPSAHTEASNSTNFESMASVKPPSKCPKLFKEASTASTTLLVPDDSSDTSPTRRRAFSIIL
nr:hypothetical protein [Legionella jordanis]